MIVISCYSMKGGVGKTTLAVNLAHAIQTAGHHTLLVDLDPQGSSGFHFRVGPSPYSKAGKCDLADSKLREYIRHTDFPNLDILASNPAYRKLDIRLNRLKNSRKQLRGFLESLDAKYEYAVLDCPPGISLLAENVFHASDAIVIPVIPTVLCRRTFEQTLAFFLEKGLPRRKIIPFFSMVQPRKKLHQSTMQELRASNPSFLRAFVPFSVDIENMALARRPLTESAPGRRATLACTALCGEIIARTADRG